MKIKKSQKLIIGIIFIIVILSIQTALAQCSKINKMDPNSPCWDGSSGCSKINKMDPNSPCWDGSSGCSKINKINPNSPCWDGSSGCSKINKMNPDSPCWDGSDEVLEVSKVNKINLNSSDGDDSNECSKNDSNSSCYNSSDKDLFQTHTIINDFISKTYSFFKTLFEF
jgi:hypothetical protein